MEIGMNDVDDILRGLGMNVPSSQPSSPPIEESPMETPTEESDSSLTEEDISDILEDNGYTENEIQDSVFNGEGYEEEIESYNENQGEGDDITIEQEAPDYQNALANAEEEEDYEPDINEGSVEEAREDFNQAMDEYTESNTTVAVDTGNESSETSVTVEENISEEAKIPLNSPTLLIDDSTSRFSGAEWYSEIQKQRIIVGGCGGISSNLVFQLARMVPANITIYDDDDVEMVNMAGQLFSYNDIGKSKVDAMVDMICSYTSMRQVNAIKEKFTSLTEAGDIMMCGFDNMRARKIFFDSWYDHIGKKSMEERAKCLLLDGRLSMDMLQIFCIRGDDTYNINRYQSEFLFADYQADLTVCSRKQTTYLACMIGSLMVNLFTNFVAGQLNPVIPYDLPFFTEYDAQNMIFKTEC